MILDYNKIFENIKEFLIYNGVKDEELFRNEFKKRRIYRRENSSVWPGDIKFNYIFVLGRNLRGTVRLMIEQSNKNRISEISESLETILNFGDFSELSEISVPKLKILSHNGRLEIDYHRNGRTNSLYFSAL